jgi:hypothetical protein
MKLIQPALGTLIIALSFTACDNAQEEARKKALEA